MKKKIIGWILCTAMLLAVCTAAFTAGAESWEKFDPSQIDSITVKVTGIGSKEYMGYGKVSEIYTIYDPDTLRNYSPCASFTLTKNEPVIMYMTRQVPGSWYLATYDECALLELTDSGLTVTGASYDWTGIHKKNSCYYKWDIYNRAIEITYSDIPTYGQQIFRWTRETQLNCGQSMQLPVSIHENPQDVVWSSSNDKIISVEENAYISVRHPGAVTLTASAPNGITQEIKLTANIDLTMKIGQNFALIGGSANNIIKTTGYMESPTKIQYLTNSSGTYTTMAPVRFLGESIGYRVDYTEATKQIKLTDTVNGNYIVMTLGKSEITAYNADNTVRVVFNLPVPVTLIDGSTYAPLRTIAEYSGFHCQFISNEQGDYVILDDYPAGLKQTDFSDRIWSFNNSNPQ